MHLKPTGAAAASAAATMAPFGHALLAYYADSWSKAMDITPDAAEVLVRRGVHNVACGDVLRLHHRRFDTVLLLGHGVGMAGDLAGLDRLLAHLCGLLDEGGELLLDSLDVTADPAHHAYHEAKRQAGRHVGEVRMPLEFAGVAGPSSSWLHVDARTLADTRRPPD